MEIKSIKCCNLEYIKLVLECSILFIFSRFCFFPNKIGQFQKIRHRLNLRATKRTKVLTFAFLFQVYCPYLGASIFAPRNMVIPFKLVHQPPSWFKNDAANIGSREKFVINPRTLFGGGQDSLDYNFEEVRVQLPPSDSSCSLCLVCFCVMED